MLKMLTRLEKLLASLKANKIHKVIFFLLLVVLTSNVSVLSADINSLEVNDNKLVINASGVESLKISGNDTTKVSIILPNTALSDIYSFNTDVITAQLKKHAPEIVSIKVVQYSLDPAETRIVITSSSPIQPKITQDENNDKIIVSIGNEISDFVPPVTLNKPVLKKKIDISNIEENTLTEISSELDDAIKARAEGNLDKAASSFLNLYESDSKNYWAGYYLSLIYIKKFELAKAREINQQILNDNPQFFPSYYAIGIINDINGDFENSIEMYNKANKIFPEYQSSFYRLGLAYLKKEDYAQAEQAFRRVLEIYPEHSGALQNLGLILLKHSQFEEAKNYFKMAIRPDALNNLGNIFLNSSDAREAVKYFSFALDIEPRNAIICYNLARSYQLLEDTGKAIEYYDKALALDPNMYNAQYNKAIMFANAGQNDKAIDAFYSYLDLNPEAKDANNVLSVISKLEKLK